MEKISYALNPVFSKQKSFYGKANVFVSSWGSEAHYYTLRSYDTEVLTVLIGSAGMPYAKRIWNGYSVTTLRHVNELLMQQGFPQLTARAWRAMEVGKYYGAVDVPALEKTLK